MRGLKALYQAGRHGQIWEPGESLNYTYVLGSHHWLYPAYVGLWYWLTDASQNWVIYSNAAFAAFFPAAAFGLAIMLGATRRIALLAGGLALLDPSSAVNASWLLKDSMVGFLAMAGLWATLRLVEEGRWTFIPLIVILVGLLGIVRYVAYLALILAMFTGLLIFLKRRQWKSITGLILAIIGTWVMFGLLYYAPQKVTISQNITTPIKALSDGSATLKAKRESKAADETVLRWKESLHDNPGLALMKSAAHTLFAPYPWVAIHPALTWKSFSELYYPGVLLWMACLPGIVWALWKGMQSRSPVFFLIVVFLAVLVMAYTVFLGEWSTRQRVFALPASFALAAIGWNDIIHTTRLRGRVLDLNKTS
ncbi:MAG: hypothetical protein D6698_06985 [Gammaproteobacteria bacterium]|nr:MAG: hypothetical protein D6698_06985 [Gammaproteobacteria bacterium]